MIDPNGIERISHTSSDPQHPSIEPDALAIGVDVGGSHVSAVLVEVGHGCLLRESEITLDVQPNGPADSILDRWTQAVRHCLDRAQGSLLGVGLSMPGPFDYEQGVSLIKGVDKYENLYGMNIRTALKDRLDFSTEFPVLFRNDAECYLLGEAWQGAARGHRNAIGLTLGTGFGSAFLRDGRIVHEGQGVPPDGYLYHVPFRNGTAEDYFSTRGIVKRYRRMGGDSADVREIAERASNDPRAKSILDDLGTVLAEFLDPWIQSFQPQCLVLGGNVARAWKWFGPALEADLLPKFPSLKVVPSVLLGKAALLGAARLPLTDSEPRRTPYP